jgi:hypothetical protein
MIAANKKIFNFLRERLLSDPESSQRMIYQGRRHIRTTEDEKSWLQDLVLVDTIPIFGYFQGAIYKNLEDIYFVYVAEETDFVIEGFEPIDINSGIFTALVAELNFPVIGDPLSILNSIFIQDFEDDLMNESLDRWSYDWNEISIFFPPFCIYKISGTSPFYEENANLVSLSRVISYFLLAARHHIILEFETSTINEFEKILLECSNFPFDNLFSSLIAYRWKFAFLEIYRCLEQLFNLVKLKGTHTKISTSINLIEFARLLEDELGWKVKEDMAIQEIFNQSPDEIKTMFETVKRETDYEDCSICNFFYKIRNEIVHFRLLHKEPNLNGFQWNLMLEATLHLTRYWYQEFENFL